MERLDKIISEYTVYSRSEARNLIIHGKVTVDSKVIRKFDSKFDIAQSLILIDNEPIKYRKNIYIVLNKPKGVITATEDKKERIVLDLIPDELKIRELFPVGRLDKDTTGLLIITDDGEFSHKILSPKKHIKKIYEVITDIEVTDEMIEGFAKGVKLKDCVCKEALLEKISSKKSMVTITEGKYHQIKRMFGCFGANVIELKRVQMGNYKLPEVLGEGECRELSEEEILLIQEKNK